MTKTATIRVLVHGLGQVGRLVAQRIHDRPDMECVGAVVSTPERENLDVGHLIGNGPMGCSTMSLETSLTYEADAVVFCGMGTPVQVAQIIGKHAATGKDVVTVTGLVHPPSALGMRGAADMARGAIKTGARIVGTGWNPGFLLDTLPAIWGAAIPDITSVRARRDSDISGWGHQVLDELGIGHGPETFDGAGIAAHMPLNESANLIADALGMGTLRVDVECTPELAVRAFSLRDRSITIGSIAGFELRAKGGSGDRPLVDLTWRAVFGLQSEGDEDSSELEIEGSIGVHMRATGTAFTNPYPATAERALNTLAALQPLSPGLYRPDQIAVSATSRLPISEHPYRSAEGCDTALSAGNFPH
jgi:hypothetical protein